MNYWYEYVIAFLFGVIGCVVAANILDALLPLN